jgi:tRNA (cytidine/uridine-2'-O-)-methyltransferase
MPLHIALFEPEIPPNTGNIIRLSANTGVVLHLIHPLGFSLNERDLRRAGLDYHEWARCIEHANFSDFLAQLPGRLFAFTTKAPGLFTEAAFEENDTLLFGPESRGLPLDVLSKLPESHWLRIPMLPHSRSLNLSNAVAVAVYEALRQGGFNELS